jgi:hypothetical protein
MLCGATGGLIPSLGRRSRLHCFAALALGQVKQLSEEPTWVGAAPSLPKNWPTALARISAVAGCPRPQDRLLVPENCAERQPLRGRAACGAQFSLPNRSRTLGLRRAAYCRVPARPYFGVRPDGGHRARRSGRTFLPSPNLYQTGAPLPSSAKSGRRSIYAPSLRDSMYFFQIEVLTFEERHR